MAQYNNEILVQYLDDVYSLELLCRKIQGEIKRLNNEILRGKQIISDFKYSSLPTYEVKADANSQDDIFTSIIFYGAFFLVGFLLFFIPTVGIFLGACPIALGIYIIYHDNQADKHNKRILTQEAQNEFEQNLLQYENLMKWAQYYQANLDSFIRNRDDAIAHLNTARKNLTAAYSVNIIPNKYRDIYVAYYLYDYFSSSRETDLDKVLQTMLLDQIVERLDRIIDQQEEIILNQRMALAQQEKQAKQFQQNHLAQLQAIARVEQNQQLQNDYLAMIDTNTRITNFFVTADYINKYL